MTTGVFHFSFTPDISLDEAEMTLHLATFAAEGMYGKARVRLDFNYHVESERRLIFVDGTKEVGAAIVQAFAGLLLREFGEDAFSIERANSNSDRPQGVAA